MAEVQDADRAAALDPGSVDVHATLAVTLNRLGRDEAMVWFERAIALGATGSALRLGYADALERAGRTEEAERQMELWRGSSP